MHQHQGGLGVGLALVAIMHPQVARQLQIAGLRPAIPLLQLLVRNVGREAGAEGQQQSEGQEAAKRAEG